MPSQDPKPKHPDWPTNLAEALKELQASGDSGGEGEGG